MTTILELFRILVCYQEISVLFNTLINRPDPSTIYADPLRATTI